jgi:hypothetical protein
MQQREKRFAISLLAIVSLLGMPTSGESDTTVTNARIRGLEVTASSARVDGCIGTSAVLFAASRVTRTNGSRTVSTEAILGILKLDVCNGTVVDDLVTLQSMITFTGTIDSATLSGDVIMQNILGDVVTVPLELTFTGVGEAARDRSTQRLEEGSTRIRIKHDGYTRAADVFGTIDGQDVAGTVGSAALTLEKEATLTITQD